MIPGIITHDSGSYPGRLDSRVHHVYDGIMTIQTYTEYLNRLPVSRHTRRNYRLRVKRYLEWLEGTVDGDMALSQPTERDFAVRDYRAKLLLSGLKPATVNASLAALDNFYGFLGMGPAKVRRQELPNQAPKALVGEDLRRVIKAIARCESVRNKTIALMLLHSGLRISELAALNVGDIFVTARKGEIVVRCGKNQKHRRIPMNSDLREVMQSYLAGPRDPQEPLFTSKKGNRISTNAIDHLIRQIATEAGVEMSSHTCRHTALSRLIRAGVDIVIVAEVAGHSRLETTRRYSLPTADDKIAALEKLNYAST